MEHITSGTIWIHLLAVLIIKKTKCGTSLVVQWLRLCASTAGGTGSIPGWGAKILHASQRSLKKK